MPRSTKEWHGKTDDSMPPPSVRDRIKQRDNNRCQECGIEIRTGGHLDHAVALILGGENRETNLRLLCRNCHGAKTKDDTREKSVAFRKRSKLTGISSKKEKTLKKKVNGEVMMKVDGVWVPYTRYPNG